MIPPRPRDSIELGTRDLRVVSALGDAAARSADVTVAVTAHGPRYDLRRCLASVAAQHVAAERLAVVVLIDQVGDGPLDVAVPAELADRTVILTANCGSPARARNAVLEYVESHLPACRWVARLDWDDRFADPYSLAAAVELGERRGAGYVVGGNRVVAASGDVLCLNPAGAWMCDPSAVVDRLRQMAQGTAANELPSCNLLLSTRAGLRYPDTASAEDHWLVASLLVLAPDRGAVLEEPLFADYTLDGAVTREARDQGRHRRARAALHAAAATWLRARSLPGSILGFGQEGIVRRIDGHVVKQFYAGILDADKAAWLARALRGTPGALPSIELRRGEDPETWIASYRWEETAAVKLAGSAAVADFLSECLARRVVCGNIKRSNFRLRADGGVTYIDVGNWIVPMDVSVFRDSAARLYSIGVLGASDEELLRRPADHSRPEIWERLPGFAAFYLDVVAKRVTSQWSGSASLPAPTRRPDVSLLIKACAMDAAHAPAQIAHIVDQLVGPADFAERLLVIDPHPGPFPRPHAQGDLDSLLQTAEDAVSRGTLDRYVVAPDDELETKRVNCAWFDLETAAARTVEGVPVARQLWSFEQVRTRYVLQCDVDVLVGRRAAAHDYLAEMLEAVRAPGVVGVAFNIAKDPDSPFQLYGAPAGEFKPEVRCGLLDLERLRECCPLPNAVLGDLLALTWYQALHEQQRRHGLRTLRGGHPATFYVHPPNHSKGDREALARIRDLVAQGLTPVSQWGRWDLEAVDAEWAYATRAEPLVILARGRNTGRAKVERFAASLRMQDEQSFGLVVIDDASDDGSSRGLATALEWLGARLTLVRHDVRRGRVANTLLGIRHICVDPATLVVVVDLDDALADRSAIRRLRDLRAAGHDVILAAPFRPDAPTKVYRPDFERPRETFGGDVWIHLRAFEKGLADRLPDDAFRLDGRWIEQCDDYALMVPVVEMARNPVYVPEYLSWHERTTTKTLAEQEVTDAVILRILAKAPLDRAR